jgi:putative membrane protein
MMSHIHPDQSAFESFWVSSALVLTTVFYFLGWLRLHRRERGNFQSRRVGSFLFGLSFIWIATASPLAALDHEMLTVHMVQHLILMTLAPPLILLSMPRERAHGLSQQWLQVITNPVVCWLAAAGTLVAWHIPSVFMLGMRSQTWHGIEQLSFLATGLLFWWPVIEARPGNLKWPEPFILLYLFLATLPCDILSGFLVFCDRVVYPVFLFSPRPFGLSALEDQQCAGALMWTCVTIVYLIAAAIFTLRLLSPHRSVYQSDDLAIQQFDSRRIVAEPAASQGMEAV